MELSINVPVVQTAAAVGGFMAFLAEVGAERDRRERRRRDGRLFRARQRWRGTEI